MTIINGKEDALPIIWRETADPQVYETARVGRVFNHRRPKRYPIAVVEAETEGHIQQAVRLANEQKCRISIRSGGHSWAAWSVRDNAILIDLGKYKHISYNEDTQIVSVSPSTTGSMLNEFLSKKGLLFGGGHCPDVGLGGFLLQGGMGWNCRNWGWACEQIDSLDVITAKGEKLHCDAEQNSELLWAAKGAGPGAFHTYDDRSIANLIGFPAVVTLFHLKVRKVFTNMLSSTFIYPISKYREAMDWVLKITPTFDKDTEIVAVGATPLTIGQMCIIPLFVAFKNTEEEAIAALKPANDSRPEGFIVELVNQPTSLAKEYRDQAGANPQGHRYAAENAYVKNDADVAAVLEKAFTTLPTDKTFALWYAMDPCSRREMPDMALSMQSDHYFALYTVWEQEADDERCQNWVLETMRQVVPHTEGAYMGDADFQIRQTKYWTDVKARKLMALREKWDGEGRICGYLNHGDTSGLKGLENLHQYTNGYQGEVRGLQTA